MNIDFNNIKDLPAASLADLPIPFLLVFHTTGNIVLYNIIGFNVTENAIFSVHPTGGPKVVTFAKLLANGSHIYDPAANQIYRLVEKQRIIVASERN